MNTKHYLILKGVTTMNEETMEMMEVTENEAVESEMDNDTEDSGSGMVLGLVLAGVAGMVAGGTAVYKKLKAKTGDKKPRKKRKLMWVVEDEPAEENIVDGEAKIVDEEEPEKK